MSTKGIADNDCFLRFRGCQNFGALPHRPVNHFDRVADPKDYRCKRGSKFGGNECQRGLSATRLVFQRNRKSDRADRKSYPGEFTILAFLAGCFTGSKDISIKQQGRLEIGRLDVKHSTFPSHVPTNQQRQALSLRKM